MGESREDFDNHGDDHSSGKITNGALVSLNTGYCVVHGVLSDGANMLKKQITGAACLSHLAREYHTSQTSTQASTLLTQYLADVGIVHVRKSLKDFPPFIFCPHHEGIHRTLYVGLVAPTSPRFPVNS